MTPPNTQATMDKNTYRTYPPKPLLGASTCVWHENKVLLVKRSNPPKDVWSLPGGLVDVGETLVQAAARELREETGITANIITLAQWVEIIEPDGPRTKHHYVVPMFVGTYASGTLKAQDDALDAGWFELKGLQELKMTKGTADLILKTHTKWIAKTV